MTLGYLTPPAKPEKTGRVEISSRNDREDAIDIEQQRDQQLSRAF